MLQIQILVTSCRNPNSVHRLQSLSRTRFVFRPPALRINHGVNNDRSTVLLSSYPTTNKTTQQKTEQTHTHTRPKTKTDVARLESPRKQRPTVSANPHRRKEGRRMKTKRKCVSIPHATHLKFKTSAK